MKRLSLIIIFLTIFAAFSVTAQDQNEISGFDPGITRNMGDQTFSFTVGLFTPLFNQDTSGNIVGLLDYLSLGMQGALEWHSYLSSNMKIGGKLSGVFAFTPSGRVYTMAPLTAVYTYILDLYPITIPLSIGAGISFNNLDDLFLITPILEPGIAFHYHFDPEWSLGLNVNYWWTPEIQFTLTDQTRFGNFLETSLSLMYHF